MKLLIGSATNIGSTRDVNQDAIFVKNLEKKKQNFAIGVVCDGVGGLEHGELASEFVINEIAKWYEALCGWIDIQSIDAQILFAHLKDAAEEWNEKLRQFALNQNLRTGTTMSLVMIIRNQYFIIHVGDSRIYRFNNELVQLTVDASVSRMKNGRMKSYLDNYMGKSEKLWFQSMEGNIKAGDLFFFCSDGLYHRLKLPDIKRTYKKCKKGKIDGLCNQLIEMVIERGEKDNISIGMIMARKKKIGLFF